MADQSVTLDRMTFEVGGMTCAGCAASAQLRLSRVGGVDEATVDFASGRAVVVGRGMERARVEEAIKGAGFTPTFQRESGSEDPFTALIDRQREVDARQLARERSWRQNAIVATGIWVPLEILHSMTAHGHTAHSAGSVQWSAWVAFAGAALALLFAGSSFYSSAWRAACHRTTNMDTLVVIGISASFALSAWTLVAQQFAQAMAGAPLYFAESTALLAIVSAGHWLEARGTRRATSAVKELLRLQPEFAERLSADGTSETLAASSIQVGDQIVIRPGGRVPIDGTILEGRASMDESSLTGEAMPESRSVGDRVSSGTIALDGRIVVRAEACGGDSALGRVARMVYEAQVTKAPIQRVADRVCSVFVPVVLIIALATCIGWWIVATPAVAIVTAVTVLVISCPCALGIATPLAVMVGTAEASRRGILVRTAAALEVAARCCTVAFDKTGTLTMGRPRLERIDLIDARWDRLEVLALSAGAESGSEHPIAHAVLEAAREAAIPLRASTDFTAQSGIGVHATVAGKRISVVRDESASARVEIDGVVAARMHFEDQLRPSAANAVRDLQALRCRVVLLTGDRQAAATRIASQVGLTPADVYADQTPQSKVAAVEKFGLETMMVGDGINDAGALAAAGVSVAMGSGTALAAASADAILLRSDPSALVELIRTARATFSVVNQNLFLAFLYNAAAIPLAALGYLGSNGPIIAAIAMGASDICVVGNTLRLRRRLARHRD